MSAQKTPEKNLEEQQAALQALIAQGRKEGMVRAADLNAILEKMDMTPEKFEEIYDRLEAMNIQVVSADLDLDLGVGDLELSGQVPGNSEIDCGVGKVALSLTSGDQYRLRLDKGIGSATLNGQEMVGSTYYGTGPHNLEISGGIGSIQIELA